MSVNPAWVAAIISLFLFIGNILNIYITYKVKTNDLHHVQLALNKIIESQDKMEKCHSDLCERVAKIEGYLQK